MRRSNRLQAIVFGLLLALVAGGTACGPFGPGYAGNQLLPPSPPPPIPALKPPVIRPAPRLAPTPALVKEANRRSTHTAPIDAAIHRADQHFEKGKTLYWQGKMEAARAEFNAAIDALLDAPEDAPDRDRVEKKCAALTRAIHRYDVEGLGAAGREADTDYEASPLDELLHVPLPGTGAGGNIQAALKLPVSKLPLEVNGEVLQYIKYFSSPKGHRTLVNGLRRLGRYRAMIRRIFEEEGVPPELVQLAQAESGFLPKALSRRRATGMWQFMRRRGREYGLKRTRYYDDRLDPEKATRAAARHLRDLYERLGDWYLAIAAYNCGPGRIDQAVRRTGYADFWELSRRGVLPRETRRYVPLILAMIIMTKNPKKYGLDKIVPDPPLEYNTIRVTAKTHLGLIADILGRPLAEIQALNPAILRNIAPAGYTVHVPKGTGSFVMAALETVPASKRASWRVHRVGYGETLAETAKLYRTTPKRIAMANGGAFTGPVPGDLLVVPVSYSHARRRSRPRHGRRYRRWSKRRRVAAHRRRSAD